MSLAQDLIRRREALEPLADNIPAVASALRERGFVTAFAGDDWFGGHCSPDDVDLHKRVTRELFVEALHAPSISKISYDPSYRFQSSLLRELAPLRSGSGHFSPCERELVAARARGEGPTSVDFDTRRQAEYIAFQKEVARWERLLVGCASEGQAQQCVANQMSSCCLYDTGLVLPSAQGDLCFALDVSPLIRHSSILMIPIVSCRNFGETTPLVGAMRVAFRLLDQDSHEQVVLHLDLALPGRWSSYNVFESVQELSLLCCAWETAVQVLLGGILTLPPASAG